MPDFLLKDIPRNVKDRFKLVCVSEGISMRDKLIDFMRKEAAKIEVRRLDQKKGKP